MPQDFKKALANRNVSFEEVLKDKNIVYKDIQIELVH
jgi:glutamate synthase (NADPH/NADH) large chain